MRVFDLSEQTKSVLAFNFYPTRVYYRDCTTPIGYCQYLILFKYRKLLFLPVVLESCGQNAVKLIKFCFSVVIVHGRP